MEKISFPIMTPVNACLHPGLFFNSQTLLLFKLLMELLKETLPET